MSYYPKVYYKLLKPGAKSFPRKPADGACFAGFRNESFRKVSYFAKLDDKISDDCLKFFIYFVKDFAPKNTFLVRRHPKHKDIVIWRLRDCDKRDYYRSLFLLSLFRYIQEFPEIVIALYNEKKETFEENFALFQKLHIRYNGRIGKEFSTYKYDGMSGHGLLYDYKYNSYQMKSLNAKDVLEKYETITHERFLKRFNGKKSRIVQDFLKNVKLDA